MSEDQRQRVGVRRADVDEVDVDPVDLGQELRVGVESTLEVAPVVVVLPPLQQATEVVGANALRPIRDRFGIGPPGAGEPGLQVVDRLVGTAATNGRMAGVVSFMRISLLP